MDTNNNEIIRLIRQGENLTLEFKSDLKSLSDKDLVATIVSLANTEGGTLLFKFIKAHGTIKRADVIELGRLSKDQSARLLTQLASEYKIHKHGDRRGTYYDFNP